VSTPGTQRGAPGGPLRDGPSRRFVLAVVILAGALFGGLSLFMRSMERRALAGSGVREAVDADGTVRTPVEIARSLAAMKLVTVEIETSVTARSGHESWRGGVEASVTAPVRLLYGVDLAGMEVSRVAISPLTGAIAVSVPAPERIATEVRTENEAAVVSLGWLRLRSRAGEYYLGAARKALHEEAERLQLTPEDAAYVRSGTRQRVAELVRKIAGPAVRVAVSMDE